jgi:hypothetical protein
MQKPHAKRPVKQWGDLTGIQKTGVVTIASVSFLVLIGITAGIIIHATPAANYGSTAPSTDNTQATDTSNTPPSTTLVPLKTLNTETAASLTAETTNLVNLYQKVKNDAGMSDAAAASSAFYHDKHTFDTTADMTIHNTYNNASNSYYNAHQKQPDSLDNWNFDAEQFYTDIDQWTQYKYLTLTDQLFNNPSQADQARTDAAARAYSSDLIKVQADIKALTN